MKKRILTALLAVCMAVTSIGLDVQAYNQPMADEQQHDGELEAASQEKNNTGKISVQKEKKEEKEEKQNDLSEQEYGKTEETGTSQEAGTFNDPVTPDDPVTSENGPDKVSEQKTEEKSKPEEAVEGTLNYILMEKNSLEVPDTQNVVASLGKEGARIAEAELIYKNETNGEEFTIPSDKMKEDMALFSMEFKEDSQSGRYLLKSISYTENGMKKIVQLSNLDMNVAFGVNTTVNAEPDDVLVNEEALKEVEANVIELDEDGNAISENTIENVLGNAQAGRSALRSVKGAAQNLVVVLDPGHDDTHAGASYHGYKEQDLALKIAKYCRDELKKYSGITVYMVRETGACPYGGWAVGSSAECNGKRVEFAANKRADIYVSFHLNASPSSSANGVGVYYPNGSYRPDLSQTGKDLAAEIYNKLRSLGLGSWGDGLFIRNSEDGTTYPDGSLADYLGIIRRSKLAGIPAVLIEHAFLSNASDVNNFLSSDTKLKKLGVADANAIASYYGLKKKGTVITTTISYVKSLKDETLKVKWKDVDNTEAYEVYRSTSKDGKYVKAAVIKGTSAYIDKNAEPGKRYYYKIRPVFPDAYKGEFSVVKSGFVVGKTTISSINSKSSRKLEINWKAVKAASGYQVYRRAESEKSYQIVGTVASGKTTSFLDTVPKNNVKYYYKIRSLNRNGGVDGCGTLSTAKYGKAVGNTKINSVTAVSDKNLKITWKKVSGASGYKVCRSTSKNGKYKEVAYIKNENASSYTDRVSGKAKAYWYKVQAVNTVNGTEGFSGWSSALNGSVIAKVSGFTASTNNEKTIQLSWKKVPGTAGYRIARSETKEGGYKVIGTAKSSAVSYTDTKVEAGKQYYYKIETMNRINGIKGKSGYTEPIAVKTVKKTSIAYVRSLNSGAVEINWKAVSGAYGYRVKRSTSIDGKYAAIATVKGKNKITYQDKKAVSGKKYYYTVETINKISGKNGYSGNSKIVSGRALLKPNITSRKTEKGGKITLNWEKIRDANGYQISRKEGTGGSYKIVARIEGGNVTSYTDNTRETGKTYYYRIRAFRKTGNKTGFSSYSSGKEAWTLDKVNIKTVSSGNGKGVTLQWESADRASQYKIQRSTLENSGFKTIKHITAGKSLIYTDKDVKAGTTYYYRIAAMNKISGVTGMGSYGQVREVQVMQTPSLGSISYSEDNHLKISWRKISNASGYQIQRSSSSQNGYKTLASLSGTSYIDTEASSASSYYYRVRSYGTLEDGTRVYSAWSAGKTGTAGYSIMGDSNVEITDMVKYYNSKYKYPASFYARKGAPNIQTFCKILKQEAEDEGVRAEVLFAQIILETGGMQFKGDVRIEQCNFGGLGASGNGAAGETFPNVRTGLRAQVQHLKAYGCTDPLKKACVDTRFKYVKRGTAPYVEWLPIPKNPYGTGWAADKDYDVKLLKIIGDIV